MLSFVSTYNYLHISQNVSSKSKIFAPFCAILRHLAPFKVILMTIRGGKGLKLCKVRPRGGAFEGSRCSHCRPILSGCCCRWSASSTRPRSLSIGLQVGAVGAALFVVCVKSLHTPRHHTHHGGHCTKFWHNLAAVSVSGCKGWQLLL